MKSFCAFKRMGTTSASQLLQTFTLAGICACTLGLNSCDFFSDEEDEDAGTIIDPPSAADGRSLISERTIKDWPQSGIDEKVFVQYDGHDRPVQIECYWVVTHDPSGELKPGDNRKFMTLSMDYANGQVTLKYKDAADSFQSHASFKLNAQGLISSVTGNNGHCAYTYTEGRLTQIKAVIEGEPTTYHLYWDNGNLTHAVDEEEMHISWEYGDTDNANGYAEISNIGVISFTASFDETETVLEIREILASSGLFGKASKKLPVRMIQSEDGENEVSEYSYTIDNKNRVSSFTMPNEYGRNITFHYKYQE